MQCFYCGKNIEVNGVVRQGHTFCNNLCRYSFEKFGGTLKSQSSVIETSKTEGANNTRNVVNKLNIQAAEAQKLADFESFLNNNKYIKIISAILVLLIGFLIYMGISNYVENKQAFRVLWICICFVGFIVSVAAQKKNKPAHPQTDSDNRDVGKAAFKSVFDNNFLKIVLAVLTALLIYRTISDYIEYKQTEALMKDLDKTMIQFNRDMEKMFK